MADDAANTQKTAEGGAAAAVKTEVKDEGQTALAKATDPKTDPAKTPDPAKDGEQPDAKGGEPKKEGEATKVQPIDIKLPDGVRFDEAKLSEFKTLAAEAKLTPEVAQKLVDFQAKIIADQQAAAKKEADEFNDRETAWKAETTKIPAAELGLAKRAMLHGLKGVPEAYREETRSVLENTWMGNHPGVIRVLAAAGALIAEDKLAEEGTAGHAPAGPATAAEMYPSMRKKT